MNKKLRGIIIGCVAVVVLVAALIVLSNLPADSSETASEDAAASTAAIYLNDKQAANVRKVEVTNETGSYVVNVTEESEYTIDGLDNAPLSDTSMQSFLSDIGSINAKALIDEEGTDLNQYGLGQPRATVTVTYSDGSSNEVRIGNDAPASEGVYCMVDDDPKVYLFLTSKVDDLLLGALDMVDKTITNTGVVEPEESTTSSGDDENANLTTLVKLTLGGTSREEPIVVEPSTHPNSYSLYDITSPNHRVTNSDATGPLLTNLFGLTAEEVITVNPTQEELEQYGLADPYSTAEAIYPSETISLICSAPQDGYVYVMNRDKNVIYRMADEIIDTSSETRFSSLSWINAQYSDLLSHLVTTPYIGDLKSLTVSTADQSYTFDLSTVKDENDTDVTTAKYQGEELDIDIFKDFYQVVIAASNEGMLDEEVEGEPVLTYRFEYTEGRDEDVVEFYSTSNLRALIKLNGDGGTYCYQSYVDKAIADIQRLLNGEEITTVY
ncbi:MAG TPA: DUF4340 domain-containing protein [Candidatus Gallacutalibacter stercoravium]|nr:DUF4340 domain-containing protein [Candidatus Gallacutalibacter stercoravium]